MTEDKAKLEEVKAILHELQRIRPDLATLETAPRPEAGAASSSVNGTRQASAAQETVALRTPQPRGEAVPSALAAGRSKGLLAAGGGIAVLAVAAGAVFLLNQPERTAKAPENVAAISPTAAERPAVVTSDPSLNIVQHAQKLMSDGDIKGARQMLQGPAEGGSADAAFSLARSFDPNFLQTVTDPNAGPDLAQAELWYTRWHEAAVKQGLVTDSLRLERILRSMRP